MDKSFRVLSRLLFTHPSDPTMMMIMMMMVMMMVLMMRMRMMMILTAAVEFLELYNNRKENA